VDLSTYLKYAGLDLSPLISTAHNWKNQENSRWCMTASLQPSVSLGRSDHDEVQEYDLMMGEPSDPTRRGFVPDGRSTRRSLAFDGTDDSAIRVRHSV
jgi:hypothetical protein